MLGGGFGQFLDLTFYLLTVILIPVQLPYGVVLVSDVQYSDSTTATAFLWCSCYWPCGHGTSPRHIVAQDYVLGVWYLLPLFPFVRPFFPCPRTVAHPVWTSLFEALGRSVVQSESTCGSVLPASADRRTVLLHAGSAGLCPSVLTELRKHFHWSLVACGLLLWLHTSTGKTLSLKELSVVALGWGRGGRRVVCRELLVLLFDIVSSIWFQLAHTNQN